MTLRNGGKADPPLTKDNPYWTDVRAVDAEGKVIDGLPDEGGYFELAIPKVLLDGKSPKLTIGWIDFYR